MSKQTQIALIVAIVLVLIGCMLFGGVMMMHRWDFSKLGENKFQTNRYEIVKPYTSISIEVDTAEILLIPSDSQKHSVLCYERENVQHMVSVTNDTLTIKAVDTRKWYEHIGLFFATPQIKVSIPQGAYDALHIKASTGDIEIPKNFTFQKIIATTNTGDITNFADSKALLQLKTSTGDICTQNVSAQMLDLTVSTGKATLQNITCQSLLSKGTTGDISLKNVVAKKIFAIKRSTGDITLERCDSAEISIQTDTGNVSGSLKSEKIFTAQSDTGRISIPQSASGGKCEITTDTGDIKIAIVK